MNARKGFTLIEILIVVAIIAILASVVLVGLGPTQQAGRDARRLSDIREVQNALELFYNKCGFYPGTAAGGGACAAGSPGATWSGANSLSSALIAANIGVTQVPEDPSTNRSYGYAYDTADNSSYVLGVALENKNNSVLNNYVAPSVAGLSAWVKDAGTGPEANCTTATTDSYGTYCISL